MSLVFHHCNCPKYQTLLTALLCLKSLTTVQTSYTPIGSSALAILSHLPHLRDLQVRVLGSGQQFVGAFSRLRSTRPFRALARVTYTVEDMAIVHCLLYSANSRSLTYIDICMLTDMSPEDAHEFTSLVALHHPVLEHLELRVRDPMPRDLDDPNEITPDQETLPSKILEPLLALPQLSTLNMASCPIVVDDSLVARMAIAWPISSDWNSAAASTGSTILESGLRLTSPLGHDIEDVPDFNGQPRYQRYRSRSPMSMSDGWSKIDEADVAAVASFLFKHLPSLSKITEGWESVFVYDVVADEHMQGAMLYEARWRRVAALVRGLHLVRQQERDWAQSISSVSALTSILDSSQVVVEHQP
ncbi:hypothetical protein C8T65DRAFT_724950 [Cerioporus squamosus]|nr:hypothetical protein C8T65DRAFT_724950 [Cerioporus squamosus]